MSARVLVIGLDAAEASLLERWTNEGFLPTFARLARNATPVSLARARRSVGDGGGTDVRYAHAE